MASITKVLPKAIIFDLDGCVWDPEMYELWGGGAPFKNNKDGTLKDRRGTTVYLMGDVSEIMHELKTDPKWSSIIIGAASSCDEPSWARECIQKFPVGKDHKYFLKDVFSQDHIHIMKCSKDRHFSNLKKSIGCSFEEMMFLDNQYGNCETVSRLGVTVVYTPNGVTRKLFEEGLDNFPSPKKIIGPKRQEYMSWQ